MMRLINRIMISSPFLSMIFSEKPASTFPDHALSAMTIQPDLIALWRVNVSQCCRKLPPTKRRRPSRR